MLLAAFAVLAVVTVGVLLLGGGDEPLSQPSASQTSDDPRGPASDPPSSAAPSAAVPTAGSSETSSASVPPADSAQSGSGGPIGACLPASLSIRSATDAPSYPVNASPALRIVIANTSPQPCTADLSDQQIELFVYFGEARIWGSHDCNIEPGTAVQTLPAGQPVTREIVWSGLSSEPGCAATRQRAPAGTYTLRATLAGVAGTPVTFVFA